MFIVRFFMRHYILLVILLIVGIGVALMEGVGVSLVFPLLQGTKESMLTNIPFPLSNIANIFKHTPLSQRLQIVAFLLFCIALIRGGLFYLGVVLAARLRVLAIKECRMACVKQVMKVGIEYFHKQKRADLQLIFSVYTETAVGATIDVIGTGLVRLCTTVILLVFLLFLSWKLTLISIFLVIASSVLIKNISYKALNAAKITNNTRRSFNIVLFEILNGMKLIRQFNREANMVDKYQNRVDNFNKALYKSTKISGSVSPIFEIVGMGILALILIVGSFVIFKDSAVWTGVLFTFIIILSRLISPVKILNQTIAVIFERIPALRELDQFLSEENKLYVKNGTTIFKGIQHGIKVRNVEFTYNPDRKIVLKNISFDIPRDSRVGIVGPSGSGKSTITELLMRFYDPQAGQIFIDDIDLRDIDLQSWRKHIGVVSQDTFLFNDTIKANIIFTKPGATEDEIEEAARRSHIHQFIQTLPAGYDTLIGESGVLLSGGQRQRLAIARAILPEPEILIFDEATSALDTESEQIVQNAINEIAQNRTVITIAHRLSTVLNSDIILVLDNGCIIEKGKHQELLQKQGLYRKLVNMQNLESR